MYRVIFFVLTSYISSDVTWVFLSSTDGGQLIPFGCIYFSNSFSLPTYSHARSQELELIPSDTGCRRTLIGCQSRHRHTHSHSHLEAVQGFWCRKSLTYPPSFSTCSGQWPSSSITHKLYFLSLPSRMNHMTIFGWTSPSNTKVHEW